MPPSVTPTEGGRLAVRPPSAVDDVSYTASWALLLHENPAVCLMVITFIRHRCFPAALLLYIHFHMRVAQPSRLFGASVQRLSVRRSNPSFPRRSVSVFAMAPSQETINGAVAQLKDIIAKTNCQASAAGADRQGFWRMRHLRGLRRHPRTSFTIDLGRWQCPHSFCGWGDCVPQPLVLPPLPRTAPCTLPLAARDGGRVIWLWLFLYASHWANHTFAEITSPAAPLPVEVLVAALPPPTRLLYTTFSLAKHFSSPPSCSLSSSAWPGTSESPGSLPA